MNMQDLIVWGVVGVVFFGSWVANAMKKANEQREMRELERRIKQNTGGRSAQADGPGETTTSGSSAMSAEELAARRRQQLQALAKKRGQGRGTQKKILTRSKPGEEPQNLTMAQRIERAKAKAQYRERAARLAQQKTQSQAQPQAARPPQAQPAPPPRPQRKPMRPTQPRTVKSSIEQRHTVTRIEADEARNKASKKVQDAKRPNAMKASTDTSWDEKKAAVLVPGKISLRQAFIYKELLDQPVSLREMDRIPGSIQY